MESAVVFDELCPTSSQEDEADWRARKRLHTRQSYCNGPEIVQARHIAFRHVEESPLTECTSFGRQHDVPSGHRTTGCI